MKLPVYLYGHPVLRKVSTDIDKDYPNLDEFVKNMFDTMYGSNGIGIAAPQVGRNDRIIVIDVDPLKDTFKELAGVCMVLINPHLEVLEDGETNSREEGCLSLPGISENVVRTEKVHLTWLDEKFEAHDEVFSGYLARVIQHEYDHLEGQVFTDHISVLRKQFIRNKLANIAKGKVRCDYKVRSAKK